MKQKKRKWWIKKVVSCLVDMAYDKLITNSSSVARIQYSPEKQILRITYNQGATWDYAGVPETVWEELMLSPSVGSYVAQQVKPKYTATKVGEDA